MRALIRPARCLGPEAFDSVSDYVIAPPRLCDKFTTIRVAGAQLLGYPMCISNDRYHRNALLFNFCALLGSSTDATTWQPAVHKISSVFRLLEEEQQFLSTRETRVRGRVGPPGGGGGPA